MRLGADLKGATEASPHMKPWMIDQLEREQRQRQEKPRPRLQMPIPDDNQSPDMDRGREDSAPSSEDTQRGVWVIDL